MTEWKDLVGPGYKQEPEYKEPRSAKPLSQRQLLLMAQRAMEAQRLGNPFDSVDRYIHAEARTYVRYRSVDALTDLKWEWEIVSAVSSLLGTLSLLQRMHEVGVENI